MTTNPPPLTTEEITAIVESLLFVADEPVSVSDLAAAIEVTSAKVEKALNALTESYRGRYLQLQRHKKKVQLVTAPKATTYIERFLGLSASGKLSTAALETLGIIAYKQPITRPEIEAIRGVNSDGVLRTLLSKGLIEEVGRLDTVGHPIQYGTTFEFLKYFGVKSLDELPALQGEGETG
jgi:segregation and condensation protein B